MQSQRALRPLTVWFESSLDIVPVGPCRVWPGVSSGSAVGAAVCGRGQEPAAGARCAQERRTPVTGSVPEPRLHTLVPQSFVILKVELAECKTLSVHTCWCACCVDSMTLIASQGLLV